MAIVGAHEKFVVISVEGHFLPRMRIPYSGNLNTRAIIFGLPQCRRDLAGACGRVLADVLQFVRIPLRSKGLCTGANLGPGRRGSRWRESYL